VLGIRIRDGDIGNSLEPGGTKGRILDIEVPAESFTEFSHSYYTFRVFLRGESEGFPGLDTGNFRNSETVCKVWFFMYDQRPSVSNRD